MEKTFEKASRMKLRFHTTQGNLALEDLWDLSLTKLDAMFKKLNKTLKESDEDSLLSTKTSGDKIVEMQVTIVKHVVEVKLAEKEASENRAANKLKREKLIELLAKKQDANMETMSEADILKEIEGLTV